MVHPVLPQPIVTANAHFTSFFRSLPEYVYVNSGNSEEGAPSFSSYLIINPILQLGFSLNSVFLEIFYPGSWSPSKYGQILCVWPALPGTRRAEKNVGDLR